MFDGDSRFDFEECRFVRLLPYDGEYIFYLVEHRVAMVTGEFVNMTLRPKDEDEVGSTSVPPSPIADRQHHDSAVCPI